MGFIGDIFGGGGQAYGEVKQNDVGLNTDVLNQQQQFANALQQQASGQGPSVASQQLQQALQQQQAASAASAAGARGVNPGLAMRNAMQQQGQAGQASAQSAALARTQEALGAEGMLGGTLQGMQNQFLGAQQANQAANLKAQEITRNAGQAKDKAGMDIVGGIGQGIMGAGKSLGFAEGGEVPAAAGAAPAPEKKNGPLSSILGGMLMGAAGKAPADQAMAGKGAAPIAASPWEQIGKSLLQKYGHLSSPTGVTPIAPPQTPQAPQTGMAKGGKVPAMLSPGEVYVPPEKTKSKEQAAHYAAHAVAKGKKVPGQAKVKGDSLENDTVPADLEEGGIVVKRSKAKDPDDAAEFVRAILASHGRKS